MKIQITIPENDSKLIKQFLTSTKGTEFCSHGSLTMEKLSAMLLEEVALGVRCPGSWEGSNMITVLASHGYTF